MIAPKFIRFDGRIVNIVIIVHIYYTKNHEKTYIDCGQHGNIGFKGDVRDELWELIKLALEPKNVTQLVTTKKKIDETILQTKDRRFTTAPPLDATDLERRVIGMFMDGSTVYNDSPHGAFIGPLSDGTPVYECE